MSSSPRSARPIEAREDLLRRFVEAARRAQIVTIVNRAQTEAELGELVAAELCEVFDAEIAFVLARWGESRPRLVGAYGLRPDEAATLIDQGVVDPGREEPRHVAGTNLLGLGARAAAWAPFGAGAARGVVYVARIYDQSFDEAEVALLEAVGASVEHALERLRVAEERERLYREATERAQAARVLGSIADGVLLVDGAGVVQVWNPAAEAVTGVRRDTVVGRPLDEALPGWAAISDSLTVASDPASSSSRGITVPVEFDDCELWLSIRGVGFDGGTVYAFHDLTEERRLEQLKADFIATVSHELRTPLAAVHGAAKTLQRQEIVVGSDVFRNLLAVISGQSDRLARLVNDILLASRVDSPELELETENVDVAEVATEVIAAIRVQAGERVTLAFLAPPSVPPVAADRDKLRQVLTNLVANAVKYSPGGGRVEVEVETRAQHVAILVRDEGLGIGASDQRLIFEKFYRVDANMARGVSGSGLGLYISRELVNRMGGTISVDSELGRGSTFIVTLPLATPGETAG